MALPQGYAERVYAGVLGKIIGVYLGRPFEGWTYERIMQELGEIEYYVHESLDKALIVVDDDISGTFCFLRSMPDHGNRPDLTAEQIGQTWLNYLIEPKTVLWWGGLGMSTEHTAFLRLRAGIPAPESGSIALNTRVVAEQIGAQIFIDGWGMIAPGDPERAADLARRAASVSHDGEAIYGAQVIAAMEAQAFVESDMNALLDVGQGVIPRDCTINRLIDDLREWRQEYATWHETFAQVQGRYGYDRYGGNCHMIPNHAVIIMSLLYCQDRFDRAMTIVNTAGWDTDCNSGNVGCLMGIKNGLAGLDIGPDFRTPVADRMYIPTAEGGECVTDAVREADKVVAIAEALDGQAHVAGKAGARFHFEKPGAQQGFMCDAAVDSRDVVRLRNVVGHSESGQRSLEIAYGGVATGRSGRVLTETMPSIRKSKGYQAPACPTLYAGQRLSSRVAADDGCQGTASLGFVLRVLRGDGSEVLHRGPTVQLMPGEAQLLEWTVEAPDGCPITAVGLEIRSDDRADGVLYLDWLTWSGAPDVVLGPPSEGGDAWLDAWVDSLYAHSSQDHAHRLVQNEGTGMALQGTRDWRDYSASAIFWPHLAASCGLAVRVQGLNRYYALELVRGGMVRLVRQLEGLTVLAEAPFDWTWDRPCELSIRCKGSRLVGSVDGEALFDLVDESPLTGGAVGMTLTEGRIAVDPVRVRPV